MKIEILGTIGNTHLESAESQWNTSFLLVSRSIEPAGIYTDDQTIAFQFLDVDKPYESYYGGNLRIKYVLRLTIEKNLSNNLVKEVEIFIVRHSPEPAVNCMVKLEAAYEDAVQIELELSQLKYQCKGVVLGRVYFHIIRVRLVYVTVQIMRKEIIGTGKNTKTYSQVVGSFEVLDGPVAKGDCIPIRIFLKSCGVTPTYNNISNRASVRYYANLYMKDEDGRSFSKMQEIIIWRPKEKIVRDGITSYKS